MVCFCFTFSLFHFFLVSSIRFTGNDWWNPLEYENKYGMIKNPMAWWCGYYDIFTQGCIAGFEGSQYYSAEDARGKSLITIDPLGKSPLTPCYFSMYLYACCVTCDVQVTASLLRTTSSLT